MSIWAPSMRCRSSRRRRRRDSGFTWAPPWRRESFPQIIDQASNDRTRPIRVEVRDTLLGSTPLIFAQAADQDISAALSNLFAMTVQTAHLVQ